MAKNSLKPEGDHRKASAGRDARGQGGNELSVLQKGNRLQITADIDLEGIAELKDVLGHYEAILKRLSVRKPPSTGVSFLITHHQKAELRERGFTDDQIHAMTPEEAHRLLGLSIPGPDPSGMDMELAEGNAVTGKGNTTQLK